MPPHRDWTRRGAGRALLYWPLVAFLLVAAFPALAVPLVVGSGFGLVVIGTVGGAVGRLRRAQQPAQTRPDDHTGPARSGEAHSTPQNASVRPWPTGRHARHPASRPGPAATSGAAASPGAAAPSGAAASGAPAVGATAAGTSTTDGTGEPAAAAGIPAPRSAA